MESSSSPFVRCCLAVAAGVLLTVFAGGPAVAGDDLERTLRQAAGAGDVRKVDEMIAHGADVDARGGAHEHTPLMYAARNGHVAVVRLLHDHGAELDLQDTDGRSALMLAANGGHSQTALVLIDVGADIDLRDERLGRSALMLAAEQGAGDIVAALLDAGASIDAGDGRDGATALIIAAGSYNEGGLATVNTLLARGAEPNRAADNGRTALMAAAARNNTDIVDRLIESGADLNTKAADGRSAAFVAAQHGATEALDRLIEAGVDLNAATKGDETPLGVAVMTGNRQVAYRLLQAGVAVDAPSKDGQPPLLIAARTGSEDMLRLLLDAGADVNARGRANGTTALMWAANSYWIEGVQRLLEAGADPALEADDGWTAKEAAELVGADDLIELLDDHS